MARSEDRAKARLEKPRDTHAVVSQKAQQDAKKNVPAGHELVGFNQAGAPVHRATGDRPGRASGRSVHFEDGSHYPASQSMATGRETPYAPHRPNRMESIEANAGLRDLGGAGPNHGVLFSPKEMKRVTVSDEDMSKRTGLPATPKSAGRGFLPRVGASPTQPYGSVAEAKAAGNPKAAAKVSQRKQEVLARHGREIGPTARTPGPVQPGTPMASSLQARSTYFDSSQNPRWYEEHAPAAIHHAAAETGTHTPEMRRATAYGSPQMPWTSGHPEDDTYRMNNVDLSRDMATHVQRSQRGRAAFTPENVGKSFSAPAVWKGKPIISPESGEQMTSKVQTEGNRIKAASAFMGDDPSKQIQSASQKVPNFDVALGAGSTSRWARRQAHNAYTSDAWDERTQGITSHYAWTGSTTPGGYDMSAMTGRRSAMKSGVTPSQSQETVWLARRNEEASRPQQQMYAQRKGKEVVRPEVRGGLGKQFSG